MQAPASWSRNLLPPHLLPPSAEGPPESVGTVLRAVAAGRTSARIAAALRAFASKSVRESWSRSLKSLTRWESLGCDAVGDKGISRLGSRIERVCYARATGADSRLVAIVSHTTDGQAAALDSYSTDGGRGDGRPRDDTGSVETVILSP